MQKPKPLRRSVIDLMTGCRLALSGGRSGLLRTGLTAIGGRPGRGTPVGGGVIAHRV